MEEETEQTGKEPPVRGSIEQLPDEVTEFILSFVSYKDLSNCKLVCKRWRNNTQNVVRVKRRKLLRALTDFKVHVQSVCAGTTPIARRFSHSAVVYDDSMYVFGGCTHSHTTFNDLWRLDLSRRQWVRPIATGAYPSPKAGSSLIRHEDSLVLFGGWTYPSAYPFYQGYQLFNDLHIYDVPHSRWRLVTQDDRDEPPPMAGHSVSVHGNNMVIFGGVLQPWTLKSNDVWCLDLNRLKWWQPEVAASNRPPERFGQIQTALDEQHLLIVGGCNGTVRQYNDAWLLEMNQVPWTWRKIAVRGLQWAPSQTWNHPACRVGDHLVLLDTRSSDISNNAANTRWPGRMWPTEISPPERVPPTVDDNDDNVNGRRGHLQNIRRSALPEQKLAPSRRPIIFGVREPLALAAFRDPPPPPPPDPRAPQLRLRRIEILRRMANAMPRPQKKAKRDRMSLYLLDVSNALDPSDRHVTWLQPKDTVNNSGPEHMEHYSLVQGQAELIMFGGVRYSCNPSNDFTTDRQKAYLSNTLHFITAPPDII